jgi:hypothetical protein
VIMTLMKRVCGGCAIGTGVWRSIETWKRIDYLITNCQPAHDSDQIVSFGALGSDHPLSVMSPVESIWTRPGQALTSTDSELINVVWTCFRP